MIFERIKKNWIWRLIGPFAVIAAIYWAGPAKVWAVLSNADLKFIALAIALAIPLAVIKGIRWKILLGSYDIKLGFADSISMYSTGMVLSAVTPGRIGDMIKIVLLVKRGCSIAKAIASNIFDRLFDVGFVLFAGYAGMWYFSGHFASQLHIINIVGVIVLAVLVVLALKRNLIKKLAGKLIPPQYKNDVKESWDQLVNSFWRNQTYRILLIIFWTIVFWMLQFFAIYLCGSALGIKVSFIYLSACAAIAAILSLLPITVAGIGTRDAVFILLLGRIEVAQPQSLALSNLVLATFLANCTIFYIISVVFGCDKVSRSSERVS